MHRGKAAGGRVPLRGCTHHCSASLQPTLQNLVGVRLTHLINELGRSYTVWWHYLQVASGVQESVRASKRWHKGPGVHGHHWSVHAFCTMLRCAQQTQVAHEDAATRPMHSGTHDVPALPLPG